MPENAQFTGLFLWRKFGRNSSVPNWNCKFGVQYVLWICSQSAYRCINGNKFHWESECICFCTSSFDSIHGMMMINTRCLGGVSGPLVSDWKGTEYIRGSHCEFNSSTLPLTTVGSRIGKWDPNWMDWRGCLANQLFSARLGCTNCIDYKRVLTVCVGGWRRKGWHSK